LISCTQEDERETIRLFAGFGFFPAIFKAFGFQNGFHSEEGKSRKPISLKATFKHQIL